MRDASIDKKNVQIYESSNSHIEDHKNSQKCEVQHSHKLRQERPRELIGAAGPVLNTIINRINQVQNVYNRHLKNFNQRIQSIDHKIKMLNDNSR